VRESEKLLDTFMRALQDKKNVQLAPQQAPARAFGTNRITTRKSDEQQQQEPKGDTNVFHFFIKLKRMRYSKNLRSPS
jgi:hypothetical protein